MPTKKKRLMIIIIIIIMIIIAKWAVKLNLLGGIEKFENLPN